MWKAEHSVYWSTCFTNIPRFVLGTCLKGGWSHYFLMVNFLWKSNKAGAWIKSNHLCKCWSFAASGCFGLLALTTFMNWIWTHGCIVSGALKCLKMYVYFIFRYSNGLKGLILRTPWFSNIWTFNVLRWKFNPQDIFVYAYVLFNVWFSCKESELNLGRIVGKFSALEGSNHTWEWVWRYGVYTHQVLDYPDSIVVCASVNWFCWCMNLILLLVLWTCC